ncbi:MAG: phosphomannomutase/phosphoglucomutase [bacterium]
MGIFKAYDIRGIVPSELDEEKIYRIGRAFVVFSGCGEVVVGRDVRLTADALFAALADGITDQGADVLDVGRCDTPFLYFASQGKPAALMLTASHNPKEYNGLKLCRENAVPLSGDTGIAEIEKVFNRGAFPPAPKGKIRKVDRMDEFISFNRGFAAVGTGKRLKMVADGANGAGTLTFPRVMEGLDVDFVPLYMEPDGTFPNHEANPLIEENLRDLQRRVVEEGADLGVALDGDADRCMFVDETGAIQRADVIGALIAADFLKRYPGATALYDLRSSAAVREEIEKHGGRALQCRVGHAFIKRQMREHNAVFACELSGHFYFRDHFFTESSCIAAISVLNMLSAKGTKLSEAASAINRYAHSGEINFKVDDKNAVLAKLEKSFPGGRTFHLDGLSVEFDTWWFNVRPSNTEPLLRLNLEARSTDEMENRKAELIKFIEGS